MMKISKNTPLKPFDKHWQFCVGSGHASLALRSDYCEQLKMVRQELGVERVRFHGIFCDDMHTSDSLTDVFPLAGFLKGAPSFTERSFRLCALAYDNLLAAGVKPFVELGFMPKALAKTDTRGSFFYKPCVSMPRDDAEWAQYIQDFLAFLTERYGTEEIETWHYEVWNEPDLRTAFFDGTQDDYFHLYEITARAIKAVNPKLMVGGPSTSNSKWIKPFVAFCSAHNVPLDFITTHQYSGDPLGGVSDEEGVNEEDMIRKYREQLSKLDAAALLAGLPTNAILPTIRRFMRDEEMARDDLTSDLFPKNAAIVKQQAQGLPVYYTEWNTSAVFTAYSNDTRRVAAYDVKTALAIEGKVTGTSIWCFSDIFEEMHPFPEEFHGGFGMMTQSGIKKPVYHAIKMLSDAGAQRYELEQETDSDVTVAAFSGEEETQVIMTRQNMKNLFDLPKQSATVSIALDQEPKRVYLQRIDEDHCNPLKAWQEMGSPQMPTREQVAALKAASAMQDEEIPYTYEAGTLEVIVDLGVNDVYFIRVVR